MDFLETSRDIRDFPETLKFKPESHLFIHSVSPLQIPLHGLVTDFLETTQRQIADLCLEAVSVKSV